MSEADECKMQKEELSFVSNRHFGFLLPGSKHGAACVMWAAFLQQSIQPEVGKNTDLSNECVVVFEVAYR